MKRLLMVFTLAVVSGQMFHASAGEARGSGTFSESMREIQQKIPEATKSRQERVAEAERVQADLNTKREALEREIKNREEALADEIADKAISEKERLERVEEIEGFRVRANSTEAQINALKESVDRINAIEVENDPAGIIKEAEKLKTATDNAQILSKKVEEFYVAATEKPAPASGLDRASIQMSLMGGWIRKAWNNLVGDTNTIALIERRMSRLREKLANVGQATGSQEIVATLEDLNAGAGGGIKSQQALTATAHAALRARAVAREARLQGRADVAELKQEATDLLKDLGISIEDKNYYKLLGLESTATPKEIENAINDLTAKAGNNPVAKRNLREIGRVLRDPELKRLYDLDPVTEDDAQEMSDPELKAWRATAQAAQQLAEDPFNR